MTIPDWRSLVLREGVLREPAPDASQIVLWTPAGAQGPFQLWERVSTLPGGAVASERGVGSVPAVALPVRRRRRFFGRLLRRGAGDRTWLLPDGAAAEQWGERRTDLVLAWSEDPTAPLDEARARARWPAAKRIQPVGENLVLVDGVGPVESGAPPDAPVPAGEPAAAEEPPRRTAETLLAAARASGDDGVLASALTDLAVLCRHEGDAAAAAALLEEAVPAAVRSGDRSRESEARAELSTAVLAIRQPARARALAEEAVACARAAGDRFAEKIALERLGHVASALRTPAAVALYGQAAALARALADRKHEAELLWRIAVEHAAAGRPDEAAAAAQAAVGLWEKAGAPEAGWFAEHLRRYRAGDPAVLRGAAGAVPPPFADATVVSASHAPPPPAGSQAAPGMLRMAVSAAQAMARFLGSGLKTVPAETLHARLQTCAGCEHHTGLRCRLCGCFTAAKARLPHERCPIDKWPV